MAGTVRVRRGVGCCPASEPGGQPSVTHDSLIERGPSPAQFSPCQYVYTKQRSVVHAGFVVREGGNNVQVQGKSLPRDERTPGGGGGGQASACSGGTRGPGSWRSCLSDAGRQGTAGYRGGWHLHVGPEGAGRAAVFACFARCPCPSIGNTQNEVVRGRSGVTAPKRAEPFKALFCRGGGGGSAHWPAQARRGHMAVV